MVSTIALEMEKNSAYEVACHVVYAGFLVRQKLRPLHCEIVPWPLWLGGQALIGWSLEKKARNIGSGCKVTKSHLRTFSDDSQSAFSPDEQLRRIKTSCRLPRSFTSCDNFPIREDDCLFVK
jgi:hypothetical protein